MASFLSVDSTLEDVVYPAYRFGAAVTDCGNWLGVCCCVTNARWVDTANPL